MPAAFRVFVNDQPVEVADGAAARDAIRILDPALADRLAEGGALLTDGRGIDLPPDAALRPGAILRIVVRARRREGAADADA